MSSSNININNDENISSKVFNMFGTINSSDIKYYKIYGYQIDPKSQKGMLILGSSKISLETNLTFQNSFHYFNDEGYSELGIYDNQQVLSLDSENIIRQYIGDDINDTFTESFKTSEVSKNMFEFVSQDLNKRIQVIQSDNGFNIFYMHEGEFLRYEEYHLFPNEINISMDDESLRIIKTIIINVVDKYNLKFANKILAFWKIEDMELTSSDDEDNLSDTEKEMRALGMYNDVESDDSEDESDESDEEFDNESTCSDDEIRPGSPVIENESSENDDSDSEQSEIDSDLERILMG